MSNNLQDIIPVVYAQKCWPFTQEDVPTHNDVDLDYLSDVPLEIVDAQISLIIGMNRSEMVKPLKIVDGPSNAVYASLHKLGWAINGPVNSSNIVKRKIVNRITVTDRSLIENQIKTMYDHDFKDAHISTKDMSQDDLRWKNVMESTLKHTDNKNYEINLPLRDNIKLPCNRASNSQYF